MEYDKQDIASTYGDKVNFKPEDLQACYGVNAINMLMHHALDVVSLYF